MSWEGVQYHLLSDGWSGYQQKQMMTSKNNRGNRFRHQMLADHGAGVGVLVLHELAKVAGDVDHYGEVVRQFPIEW